LVVACKDVIKDSVHKSREIFLSVDERYLK
jgi:hypothetical protein